MGNAGRRVQFSTHRAGSNLHPPLNKPHSAQPARVTLAAGGVHEDPRKLADFAARTEARNCQLDQEEAGIGVTRRDAVLVFRSHSQLALCGCLYRSRGVVSSRGNLLLLKRAVGLAAFVLATVCFLRRVSSKGRGLRQYGGEYI